MKLEYTYIHTNTENNNYKKWKDRQGKIEGAPCNWRLGEISCVGEEEEDDDDDDDFSTITWSNCFMVLTGSFELEFSSWATTAFQWNHLAVSEQRRRAKWPQDRIRFVLSGGRLVFPVLFICENYPNCRTFRIITPRRGARGPWGNLEPPFPWFKVVGLVASAQCSVELW